MQRGPTSGNAQLDRQWLFRLACLGSAMQAPLVQRRQQWDEVAQRVEELRELGSAAPLSPSQDRRADLLADLALMAEEGLQGIEAEQALQAALLALDDASDGPCDVDRALDDAMRVASSMVPTPLQWHWVPHDKPVLVAMAPAQVQRCLLCTMMEVLERADPQRPIGVHSTLRSHGLKLRLGFKLRHESAAQPWARVIEGIEVRAAAERPDSVEWSIELNLPLPMEALASLG